MTEKKKVNYFGLTRDDIEDAYDQIDGIGEFSIHLPEHENLLNVDRRFDVSVDYDQILPEEYDGYFHKLDNDHLCYIHRETGNIIDYDAYREYEKLLSGSIYMDRYDGRVCWEIEEIDNDDAINMLTGEVYLDGEKIKLSFPSIDLPDHFLDDNFEAFLNFDVPLSELNQNEIVGLYNVAAYNLKLWLDCHMSEDEPIVFQALPKVNVRVDRHAAKYYICDPDDMENSVWDWHTAEQLNNGDMSSLAVSVEYVVNGDELGFDSLGLILVLAGDYGTVVDFIEQMIKNAYLDSVLHEDEYDIPLVWTVTYSIVTEESCKDGDFAEHGFVGREFWHDALEGENHDEILQDAKDGEYDRDGDIYDLESDVSRYGTFYNTGSWLSDPDGQIDPASGDVTEYNLHIEEGMIDNATLRRVFKTLGVSS